MQGIAVVCLEYEMWNWTNAPRGQVLQAYGQRYGTKVVVRTFAPQVEPTWQEKIAALADRIVSAD